MNKLIIANWGVAHQGKSTSVRGVFDLLSQKYPTTVLIDDGDIKAIIDINGILVGIESQGDPSSRMKNSINDFISKGCEIIVCACRTWGETTNEIESLKKQGFDVIWTQNDRTDNAALHKALNKLYAVQIETVINLHINNSNNIK